MTKYLPSGGWWCPPRCKSLEVLFGNGFDSEVKLRVCDRVVDKVKRRKSRFDVEIIDLGKKLANGVLRFCFMQ